MRFIISLTILFLGVTSEALIAQDPEVVIERAILAAGGKEALSKAPGFFWRGTARIHLPNQELEIAGEWKILPPDSALVTTWLASQGPATARTMVLAGPRGWVQRAGADLAPMPSDLHQEERHQFYLYSLMRLVPLLEPGFTLQAAEPDTQGTAALRVHRQGRPDVTLYFDPAYRLSRLKTVFASGDSAEQDIRLTGSIESQGVRWFRQMEIRKGGEPYFDLVIEEFRVLPTLADPRLRGVKE